MRSESARRILLRGDVQGCGLRPALARLAAENQWSGSVRNSAGGVEVIVQGQLPSDHKLLAMLRQALPSSAVIDDVACEAWQLNVPQGFRIAASEVAGPLTAQIPRDAAVCADCVQDARDPGNRRFGYVFTTCAQCGPRYSVLLSLPFDRERTTLRVFEMCAACRAEYHNPHDRRFHAQTISCPHCGPQLWLADARGQRLETNQQALEVVAAGLKAGAIVALRGIGGYQLLANAASSAAIALLRDRKHRPVKPFAVQSLSLAEARRLAEIDSVAEQQLLSPANPIVLLPARRNNGLAAEIHPGLSDLGLMLPTTVLHLRLLELTGGPLICTSGNREGEPLAYQVDEATQRLQHVADLFLHHDREIHRPIDDSVVRVIAGQAVTIRAGRGIAPLPLFRSSQRQKLCAWRHLLAVGGQHKSAMAFTNGTGGALGPHLGEIDSVSSQDRWVHHVAQQQDFTNTQSDVPLVCDAHPDYFSTQWAHQQHTSTQPVWHHHAHVVAGMLEHGWLDREVLGISWDGTGLGPDGTIWGGEFLRASATTFDRVAHLRPFALPGGEAAITDVRRVGVAVLSQLAELTPADIGELVHLTVEEVLRIQRVATSRFSVTTTSCGRLFDVAALLVLHQTESAYEGHAAMCLESVCDPQEQEAYRLDIIQRTVWELDWRSMMRELCRDRREGVSPAIMATRFHHGLAGAIREVARFFPDLPVVLTGGVFQNRVLVERLVADWPAKGPAWGLPGLIPPNDGGLAAGQLAVALSRAARKEMQHVSGDSWSADAMDRPRSVVGNGRD